MTEIVVFYTRRVPDAFRCYFIVVLHPCVMIIIITSPHSNYHKSAEILVLHVRAFLTPTHRVLVASDGALTRARYATPTTGPVLFIRVKVIIDLVADQWTGRRGCNTAQVGWRAISHCGRASHRQMQPRSPAGATETPPPSAGTFGFVDFFVDFFGFFDQDFARGFRPNRPHRRR